MEKRKRLFFVWFCCCLLPIVIIVVGTFVPIVIADQLRTFTISSTSTTGSTTTTGSSSTTTITTSTFTTGSTTSTDTTGSTTPPPTTAPVVTPRTLIHSNYVDLDAQLDRFVIVNFTTDRLPIALIIKQQDKQQNTYWTTYEPCFYVPPNVNSVLLFGNVVTIDQITHDFYLATMCLNFTTNITMSYLFKFDMNGILIWKTEIDGIAFGNVYNNGGTSRFTIKNGILYMIKKDVIEDKFVTFNTTNGAIIFSTNLMPLCPALPGFQFFTGFLNSQYYFLKNGNITITRVTYTTLGGGNYQSCVVNTDINLNVNNRFYGVVGPNLVGGQYLFARQWVNSTDGSFYEYGCAYIKKYTNTGISFPAYFRTPATTLPIFDGYCFDSCTGGPLMEVIIESSNGYAYSFCTIIANFANSFARYTEATRFDFNNLLIVAQDLQLQAPDNSFSPIYTSPMPQNNTLFSMKVVFNQNISTIGLFNGFYNTSINW